MSPGPAALTTAEVRSNAPLRLGYTI